MIIADNYLSISKISNIKECKLRAEIIPKDKKVLIENDYTKNHMKHHHLVSFKSNHDLISAYNDLCKITVEFFRNGKKMLPIEIINLGINYQVVNYYWL